MMSADKSFVLTDLILADFAAFDWLETEDWDFSISKKFSQFWQLRKKQKIEATFFFNNKNSEKAFCLQQHKYKWSRHSDYFLETVAKTADHSKDSRCWFTAKWDVINWTR